MGRQDDVGIRKMAKHLKVSIKSSIVAESSPKF